MSAVFDGSTQYLSLASAIASGVPLSFAAWIKPTSITGTHVAVGIGNSSAANNRNRFYLATASANVSMVSASAAAAGASSVAGVVSTGAWQFIFGRSASTISRYSAYGTTFATPNTTGMTPSGLNGTQIGAMIASSAAVLLFAGKLSHVAIWSTALSDSDENALAGGANPSTIQAANLLAYLPLTADFTDTKGNAWTNNGTATIDGADNPTVASASNCIRQIVCGGGD